MKTETKKNQENEVPKIEADGFGSITFYGDQVDVAFKQDKVYVLLRTLCKNMGVDWSGQFRKMKEHEVLMTCVVLTPMQVSGQKREVMGLDVEYLPYFLALIQPKRVAQHLRPKIIAYQKEVADVLKQYFYSGAAVNPKATLDPAFLQDALASAVDRAVEKVEEKRSQALSDKKLEHLKYLIEVGNSSPKIDPRNVSRVYELYTNAIVGDITVDKRQVDVTGFLKDKGTYTIGNAISFGHYLSKFYERMTGEAPKHSVTVVNGKETMTKYYTLEDLDVIEDAFEEWVDKKNIDTSNTKKIKMIQGAQ